jgi:hypothetical protein
VCPNRWQRLHCRGRFRVLYVSTFPRRPQRSVKERNFRYIRASRQRYSEVWCQRTVLLGVLILSLWPKLHESLHIDAQGLQPLRNLGFGHTLAQVSHQQAHASILRVRKGVKIHTLALIEGRQSTDSGPETVGSLGHQHQDLYSHLDQKLACWLRANQSRNLRVSSPQTRTPEFCCVASRRERLCHRTHHRVRRERCALKLLPSKHQVPVDCRYPWLWAWVSYLACLARRGYHPSVRQQWCPLWRPSHLWGTWTRGSSAGRLIVPPSFPRLRGLFFSGERCRGIYPSSRPFNRSHSHYPGVRCANIRVAELPPACRGFFARGDSEFNHRALGGAFIRLCRQRRGPGSGQWPGRRAPSGRFHRAARVGQIQLVGFSLARGGSRSLLGNRFLPPAEPGWRPLGWQVGSSPDPLASASLLFFSARMSRFNCRWIAWDSLPSWALRKTSSSSPDILQQLGFNRRSKTSHLSLLSLYNSITSQSRAIDPAWWLRLVFKGPVNVPFHNGQVSFWDNLPPVAITPSLKKTRPSVVIKIPLA